MFRNPTVFVLGAGASWHYGYPTGEALVGEMLQVAQHFLKLAEYHTKYSNPPVCDFVNQLAPASQHLPLSQAKWMKFNDILVDFSTRLKAADPLVIDYFLGHNPSLADLGKFLIAWVLHRRAHLTAERRLNANRQPLADAFGTDGRPLLNDNWCRFIVSKLSNGCFKSEDLLKNDVSFVTFNYDQSLEGALKNSLDALSIFEKVDIDKFLSADRVLHVYGSLTGGFYGVISRKHFDAAESFAKGRIGSPDGEQIGLISSLMDAVWLSGKTIRIIDPEDKNANEDVLQTTRKKLSSALYIYVLGYGFDSNNNDRIGLTKENLNWGNADRNIFYTNLNDSNRVNKIAGLCIANKFDALINNDIYNPRPRLFLEKSRKNVYDALAIDFFDFGNS